MPVVRTVEQANVIVDSLQDASLVRLPRAYAPHVQEGLQGCAYRVMELRRSRRIDHRIWCYTEHGPVKLSTFLINYHVGDIVDIKANAAQQKGMPHKYYHGCVIMVLFLFQCH